MARRAESGENPNQTGGIFRKQPSVSKMAVGRGRHCPRRRPRHSLQRPPPHSLILAPLRHGAPSVRPPGAGPPSSPRPPVPPSVAPATTLRVIDARLGGAPEKGSRRPLVRPERLGPGIRDRQEVPWSCGREGRHSARRYVVLSSRVSVAISLRWLRAYCLASSPWGTAWYNVIYHGRGTMFEKRGLTPHAPSLP